MFNIKMLHLVVASDISIFEKRGLEQTESESKENVEVMERDREIAIGFTIQ